MKIEVHHAISIAIEDKSPRISTLCYVVRDTNGQDSSQTGHDENLGGTAAQPFRLLVRSCANDRS